MTKIKIDNEKIKNSKNKINYLLFKEDFYKAVQRIDTKKFCNSKEAAILFDSIENTFAFPKIAKELLEKKINDKKLLNIFLCYASSSYCKNKIESIIKNEQKLKVKVDINFNKNFDALIEDILKKYSSPLKHEILMEEQSDNFNSLEDVINFTDYFFESIAEKALNEKENYNGEFKGIEDICIEFDNFIVKGFNSEKIESEEKEKISFSDVGGLKQAKKEFIYLSKGLKNPEIYEQEGTKPPQGIILVGPPGVGKTLLAEALAYESGLPFTRVSIKDIVSKWYGDSEKNMATYLNKEGIVFLDEIDSLARSRGYDSSEATTRIVNTMNQIIGKNKNTFYIAATNRLEDVDEAIKRAGRFDKIIYCLRPDYNEITEIFDIHKNKAENLAKKNLFENIDYNKISKSMEAKGFTGADISEIIRRCLEERVYLRLDGKKPNVVSTNKILDNVTKYERGNYEK